MPTAPAVLPNPLVKLVSAAVGAPRDRGQRRGAEDQRARNGCIFNQLISPTMTVIPTRHARTSWPLPAVLIGSASGEMDG